MSSDDQESVHSDQSVHNYSANLHKNEEIIEENAHEIDSISGEDTFPISGSGNYIKKIRERFEQSNKRINKEIIRVNPDDVRNVMDQLASLTGMSELGIDNEDIRQQSRKSRRSVVSSAVYDDMISQLDTASLAPSRRVKRKKGRKLKHVLSKHSIVDGNLTDSKSQSTEGRITRKSKVIHNKTVKKQPRKALVRNASKELRNEFTSATRRSSEDSNSDEQQISKLERSKSYTKVTPCDNKIATSDMVEDLYSCAALKSSDFSKDKTEDLLLKNLNFILDSNNFVAARVANGLNNGKNHFENQEGNVNGDYDKGGEDDINEDTGSQLLKHMNNYELPTIASKMKSVDRNAFTRQSESNKRPFVVGTSITTTNNLYLLKQQIASKLKTYCLSSVNDQQLSGWNVNNLRLLIMSIEKLSANHKLKNNYRGKQALNQPAEEEVAYESEMS